MKVLRGFLIDLCSRLCHLLALPESPLELPTRWHNHTHSQCRVMWLVCSGASANEGFHDKSCSGASANEGFHDKVLQHHLSRLCDVIRFVCLAVKANLKLTDRGKLTEAVSHKIWVCLEFDVHAVWLLGCLTVWIVNCILLFFDTLLSNRHKGCFCT